MLYLIIGLFAFAAIFGIVIAMAIYQKKPSTPKGIVAAHGIFAATALVLLIFYWLDNPNNSVRTSIILFVVAALGGAVLLVNDLRKKPGPFGLVVVHALVAVSAFLLLLGFVLF